MDFMILLFFFDMLLFIRHIFIYISIQLVHSSIVRLLNRILIHQTSGIEKRIKEKKRNVKMFQIVLYVVMFPFLFECTSSKVLHDTFIVRCQVCLLAVKFSVRCIWLIEILDTQFFFIFMSFFYHFSWIVYCNSFYYFFIVTIVLILCV